MKITIESEDLNLTFEVKAKDNEVEVSQKKTSRQEDGSKIHHLHKDVYENIKTPTKRTRLTSNERIRIKNLLGEGLSGSEIESITGRSSGTISRIKKQLDLRE